jgi:predicted DNA-binding transcriptional regulator AlpA
VGDAGKVDEPDPGAEWWTTSDVAAYLGLRRGTVSSYRKRGQMPAPDNTVGRTHMWKPARIITWHKSRPRPGVGGRPVPSREAATAPKRERR